MSQGGVEGELLEGVEAVSVERNQGGIEKRHQGNRRLKQRQSDRIAEGV